MDTAVCCLHPLPSVWLKGERSLDLLLMSGNHFGARRCCTSCMVLGVLLGFKKVD